MTAFYIVLIAIVTLVEIEGVELAELVLWGITKVGVVQTTGLSIFLVVTFFLGYSLFRLFIRKAKRMEDYHSQAAITLKGWILTPWVLHLSLCFVMCCFWSWLLAWFLGSSSLTIVFVFGSTSLLAFIQAYLFFICNDFDYTQDVNKLNRWIDNHNKSVSEIESKKSTIQAQLLSGEMKL